MMRMGNLARTMNTAVRPRTAALRGQWSLPLPSDQGDALSHFSARPPAIDGSESRDWRSRWQRLEAFGYDTGRRLRDTLLGPLARVCVACGIAPAGISLASVAVMAGFMAMVRVDLRLAAAGLLIANLMDGLDGVVARQQSRESDRGKFTDVVCGSLNLALFGTGLVYAGLLDGALGVFGVFLLMFSKVLRMIHRGFIAPSDWLFKPVAGFAPNLICAGGGGTRSGRPSAGPIGRADGHQSRVAAEPGFVGAGNLLPANLGTVQSGFGAAPRRDAANDGDGLAL